MSLWLFLYATGANPLINHRKLLIVPPSDLLVSHLIVFFVLFILAVFHIWPDVI